VDQALAEAWEKYREGEFRGAVRLFEGVVDKLDTSDPRHLKALYGLATTHALRRPDPNREMATVLHRQVIASDLEGDLAAWSLLALARMKHLVSVGQTPDYNEAREAYQEVIDRFPDHRASHEAFLYQQSTYVVDMDLQSTAATLERLKIFIDSHPDSPYLSLLWALRSTCCETLGRPDEWLEAEIMAWETAELDPMNPLQDFAWNTWRIATIAEFEVGDFESAKTYYTRLVQEYPEDIRVHAAKAGLKRMEEMAQRIRKGE